MDDRNAPGVGDSSLRMTETRQAFGVLVHLSIFCTDVSCYKHLTHYFPSHGGPGDQPGSMYVYVMFELKIHP